MYTETGLSDIVTALRHFHFQVTEMSDDETVSGQPGFSASRAGLVFRYDGELYCNNEPVETPYGNFDITSQEIVQWFVENFDRIAKYHTGENQNNPSNEDHLNH